MKETNNFSKQLLVEGNDDFHFISAFCFKIEILENFNVIDCTINSREVSFDF